MRAAALLILVSLHAMGAWSPAAGSPVPSSPRSRAVVERVAATLDAALAEKGLELGSPLFIRIFKESRELEVWIESEIRFELFKTYEICSFSGTLGPKLERGDRQSPEGYYHVSPARMNPSSRYHLSFDLGYPNEYDRAHRRTGSALMVHGECVSIGCYAMGNEAIEEIFVVADAALRQGQRFFRVHVFPFRMTPQNMVRHAASKWRPFWENLKEGYDHFERYGRPPNVEVRNGRYVFELDREDPRWRALEPGLAIGVFRSPQRSDIGDSTIRVLRIDPRRFELRLLSASATEEKRALTAKEWSRRNGLTAAINASMYQQDHRTSISLMRTASHVNNPRLSKDMTVLAFDRLTPDVPPVTLIDRQCDDFENLKEKYGTLVQSIRMISCEGKNVWGQQPRKWSTAAVGTDVRGRVLFIHVRSPYSTHDLIRSLMKLPVGISRAMYVEGGPEAQLYVRSGGAEYEFVGSYETLFREDDSNATAWAVPNVVGVVRRAGPLE